MILHWILAISFLFTLLTLLWWLSVKKKDVSIVDPAWSLGIFLQPFVIFFLQKEKTVAQWLMLILVGGWAFRLSGYLIYRLWGKGEDKRYQAMRENDPYFIRNSLWKVFWLQGILMCLVAIPLNLIMIDTSYAWGGWSLIALLIALAGLIYETVADLQLLQFKANLENRGKVLDKGLWGRSRHPNYFGEFLFWWGIYLLSLPVGWAITWVSPALMTILLLKVSGVTLLEKHMEEKETFSDYKNRVPPFFPKL
ncbi:MAG: DUF1295 domain-containing protein [Chlamydiia bacterium]